jgi:hypothetical protein
MPAGRRFAALVPARLALALAAALAAPGCASSPAETGDVEAGDVDAREAETPPAEDGGPDLEEEAAEEEDAAPDEPGDESGAEDAPPATVGVCGTCTEHAECGPPARCILLGTGARACSPLCNPDVPSCPRGFHCVENAAAPGETTCVPLADVCCIDQDDDGFGEGEDCRGPDCNDDVEEINPGRLELCNEVDDDCDGDTDEEVVDCGAPECREDGAGGYEALPDGSCAGGACAERLPVSCGLFACWGGGGSGDACAVDCAASGVDDDVLCVAAAHCDDGDCLADLADGQACDEGSDCVSAHCQNGFCCAAGDCCSVVDDCPGAGTIVTTCDDAAACQGSRGEAACTGYRCTTSAGIPDDSACDETVEADSCGAFRSVYCSGEADQEPPACPTDCAGDVECDDDAHCDDVCVPDLSDGSPCDEDSDCRSNHCWVDTCCLAGDCCAMPADCPPIYGTDPTCDDPETCQGTRDAIVCLEFQCGTEAGTPDDSACTAGTEADDCGLYPSRFCNGAEEQTAPECPATCVSDAECDAVAHCDEPSCLADLPNGAACDEPSDCISGHCRNGYCCAAGDCCVSPADCPPATYAVPAACDDAATCQGTRRDPACTADYRCEIGAPLDDDRACAGLESHDCGPYPAVSCTAEESQPTDQEARCATSCGTDADCDPGAHCTAAHVCETDGAAGAPCTATRECASGLQCVDGVCCTSLCSGTCEACDLPGSAGTCTVVPAGTDPDNECGGFACDAYYWGWSGDTCHDRLDVPAAGASCDGGRACQDAADLCPAQGQGSARLACHGLCQDPRPGTCSGTTAGACDDVDPGTQTCGVGYCQVTVPQCSGGAPVTCTPLEPRAETCNNIDDDCNTITDDNVAGAVDSREPNDSCGGSFYLGTVAEENSEASWLNTIYPAGDADFFRFYAREATHTCIPFTDQDYAIQVRLAPPTGADCRDYDLYLYSDGCGSLAFSTAGGCAEESLTYTWDGECAFDDSRYFRVEVRPIGAAWECADYTLYIDMWQL